MRIWIIRAAIFSMFVSLTWTLWPFLQSPETQAAKQQAKFLQFAGQRNWAQINAIIAPDYHDAWNESREEALNAAHEVLSMFLVVSFDWAPGQASRTEKTVALGGTLHMSGSGAAGSSIVLDRVNRMQKPWGFIWRKDGWRPGDWHLLSITQPEL